MNWFNLLQTESLATKLHDSDKVQLILNDSVRSYLNVHEGDDDSEAQQLRNVCSALARLLSRSLSETEKWDSYFWVDAILPTCAAVSGPGEVSVLGYMIWARYKQNEEWIEPFLGQVRVDEGANELLAYRLLCADAACGLGKVRYGTRHRAGHSLPEEWMFVFEANAAMLSTAPPFSMFP
jgi:hypothetical protein